MSNEMLKDLDELVREIRGDVSIYSLITPENSSEEKERFLSGETTEPDFRYDRGMENSEELRRELEDLESRLDEIEVEESVQQMYQDSIGEGEALLDIAEQVGDPEVVRSSSREIYGAPSEGAINWAEDILSQKPLDENSSEAVYGSGEMVETAEKALQVLGLDWDVETREKNIFSVNAANQTVAVPEDREFTTNEMMRLPLHEIGVHAVRGANGYEQEYRVMGAGAGGYHQAEEGLALFLEEATGLSDPELKKVRCQSEICRISY